MDSERTRLSLQALDQADLVVISSHLQDALVKQGDISYRPDEQKLIVVLRRFDWQSNANKKGLFSFLKPRRGIRRQAVLHFSQVKSVKAKGFDRGKEDQILSLLALVFKASDEPSGTIHMIFSDQLEIAIDVECIEVELRDLPAAWATKNIPRHDV